MIAEIPVLVGPFSVPDDIQLTFVGLSYYEFEWCVFHSFLRTPVRGQRARWRLII